MLKFVPILHANTTFTLLTVLFIHANVTFLCFNYVFHASFTFFSC